jgi:hypothetical protein
MEKARWGAVCPEIFIPVLMIEGKCSRLRAKPAHLVGHLPVECTIHPSQQRYEKRYELLVAA